MPLRLLLTALLLTSASPAAQARAAERRQPSVLFLIGVSSETPSANVFGPLLQRDLTAATHNDIDAYVEYMDPDRFPDADYLDTLERFLRSKYQDRRFDLIIAADRLAHNFLGRYRATLFADSPVVFFSSDPRDTAFSRSTGINISVSFKGSLESALALQPETEHVYVVTGASVFDRFYESVAREQFAHLDRPSAITYLAGLPMPVLLRQLGSLPPRSMVFLVSCYQDGSGQRFAMLDMLERVTAAASAPVYSWITAAMGRGIVGGRIVSVEAIAAKMVALAVRILNGEDPERIPVVHGDFSVLQFDARQLRRWGITESRVPPGSTILFREPTAWEQYRAYIIPGILLIVLQSATIGALLLQRARRRRVENALRESELRFRLMADTAPVLVWTARTDRQCDFFNRRWLEFTGRTAEEELGDGWLQGVHPDDVSRCLSTYNSAFDAREPFSMEYRLRRADGEYRWVFDTGVPRHSSDGTFAGFIGSCIDVTDRKAVEEALRETAQRYTLATAAGAIGIWEWDAKTRVLNVDPQFKHLLGFDEDEIPNRVGAVLARVHPDDLATVKARLQACVDGIADEYRMEHRMLHKDGSVRWLQAHGSVLKDRDGRASRLLGTTIDITERRRADQAIQERDAVLQASHREIQTLAGRLIAAQEAERTRIARDLHDDVSQDLAGLSIGLSALRRRVAATGGSEELVGEVASLQQRTIALADNVRHLSHDLHPGILQHAGIVAALTAYCDELRRLHPLDVTFQTAGDMEAIDPGVGLCLYRVAQETLRNVVTHARAHHVDVRLMQSPDQTEITIADDGEGFDIGKARQAASGLGLISIGERVRLAGGILTVISETKKGTRVHVQIPSHALSPGDEVAASGV